MIIYVLMAKRGSSKNKLGKVRHRPSSRHLFGRNRNPFSFFLFWVSVILISFLVYRTYTQNVDTFKIPDWSKSATRHLLPKSKADAGNLLPEVKSVPYTPDLALFHTVASEPHASTMPPLLSEARKKLWDNENRVWTSKPKIAFVIDDLGNRRRNEKLLRSLGSQVTYAILPKVPYSTFFSHLSKETGAQVILHQPMESEIGKNPGPGQVKIEMTDEEIRFILAENLAMMPEHIGINNHMGSLGSADHRLMEVILKELKIRGMFFLDSHTTPHFVSRSIAEKMDFPVLMRDVFLDNVDEPGYIRNQLNEVRSLARRKGHVIAIGHDRVNTLSVLLDEIPKMEKEGFQVVFLSELVDHKVGTS